MLIKITQWQQIYVRRCEYFQNVKICLYTHGKYMVNKLTKDEIAAILFLSLFNKQMT